MRIRHSRLTRDFLQVPNATVRDDRLSHMARGILVELLSRPDGWEATADDMWRASVAKHGKASPGRRIFRAAFAELKDHGYLTASREVMKGGRHATMLTLADVPQAGTSVRPAETQETPGQTDVPHAGTSDGATDVPPTGTSEPPAETGIGPARTDVPLSDVPHAGTSKEENGETNTGKNTSSFRSPHSEADEDLFDSLAAKSAAAHAARGGEDLKAFGDFWQLYPKKRDREEALKEWKAAVERGADPARITEAARQYAKERAGEEPRYTKYPANWLRKGCYDDEPDPQPGQLKAVNGKGHRPFEPPKDTTVYANGF